LGKRDQEDDGDLNLNPRYTINRPKRMGFNFKVRPSSEFASSSNKGQRLESQIELERHLAKIRRKKNVI